MNDLSRPARLAGLSRNGRALTQQLIGANNFVKRMCTFKYGDLSEETLEDLCSTIDNGRILTISLRKKIKFGETGFVSKGINKILGSKGVWVELRALK